MPCSDVYKVINATAAQLLPVCVAMCGIGFPVVHAYSWGLLLVLAEYGRVVLDVGLLVA